MGSIGSARQRRRGRHQGLGTACRMDERRGHGPLSARPGWTRTAPRDTIATARRRPVRRARLPVALCVARALLLAARAAEATSTGLILGTIRSGGPTLTAPVSIQTSSTPAARSEAGGRRRPHTVQRWIRSSGGPASTGRAPTRTSSAGLASWVGGRRHPHLLVQRLHKRPLSGGPTSTAPVSIWSSSLQHQRPGRLAVDGAHIYGAPDSMDPTPSGGPSLDGSGANESFIITGGTA